MKRAFGILQRYRPGTDRPALAADWDRCCGRVARAPSTTKNALDAVSRFRLHKFRSMQVNREGAKVTLGTSDPRITSVGRVLRKYKLDELPQLWNVVKGDMSLVGPRPEVAKYVALYTDEMRGVLTVRPGLTDPASIAGFDEGARLEAADDPEQHYRSDLT